MDSNFTQKLKPHFVNREHRLTLSFDTQYMHTKSRTHARVDESFDGVFGWRIFLGGNCEKRILCSVHRIWSAESQILELFLEKRDESEIGVM